MELSTKQFISYPTVRAFVAEISDLGRVSMLGLKLKSHVTGNVTLWVASQTMRDAENDILQWEFTPHPSELQKHPTLDGWKLVVIND